MTLCTVNGVDVTRYIDKDSYQVNSEDVYESWQNGYFKEIRIPIRKRVKGSFTIRCGNGLSFATFLSNWNAVTTNSLATIGVFVQNESDFQAIETYYQMTGVKHVEHSNGAIYDEVTVKIEES